jgi:hypothetical protein
LGTGHLGVLTLVGVGQIDGFREIVGSGFGDDSIAQ